MANDNDKRQDKKTQTDENEFRSTQPEGPRNNGFINLLINWAFISLIVTIVALKGGVHDIYKIIFAIAFLFLVLIGLKYGDGLSSKPPKSNLPDFKSFFVIWHSIKTGLHQVGRSESLDGNEKRPKRFPKNTRDDDSRRLTGSHEESDSDEDEVTD
jgi:hypothetical protein